MFPPEKSAGPSRHQEKAAGSQRDPPWANAGQNTALPFPGVGWEAIFCKKEHRVSVCFPKLVPVKAERKLACVQSFSFSVAQPVGKAAELGTVAQVPAAPKTRSRPHPRPTRAPSPPSGARQGRAGCSGTWAFDFLQREGMGRAVIF